MLALITKFNARAGHPECPRRQCVGLHSEGSHVSCSLSAASLAICSLHFTVQYVELRGYCQGLLQPQAWVSADGVLKDCVIKVYLGVSEEGLGTALCRVGVLPVNIYRL